MSQPTSLRTGINHPTRRTVAIAGACAAAAVGALGLTSQARADAAPSEQTPHASVDSMLAALAPRTVTVTGTDSVQAMPDMAEVTLGVVAHAGDAATAQTNAAVAVESVTAALMDQLAIPEDDITTASLYLNPQYDYSGTTEQIVGYVMNVTLTIKNLPLDQAGKAISCAITAGANEVNNVSYYCSEYDARYREALNAALAMARAKAEGIAEANGDTLGALLSVTEGYDGQQYRAANAKSFAGGAYAAMDEAAVADAGPVLGVDPGTIEIRATVTAEYAVSA